MDRMRQPVHAPRDHEEGAMTPWEGILAVVVIALWMRTTLQGDRIRELEVRLGCEREEDA